MSISKIFFYDFFNKRKVKRIILLLALLPVLFLVILKDVHFTSSYAGLIGITIALASTSYTLSSYATTDKLRLYISLPINSKRLIWGLVITLYSDTLLERMSIFIIAALFIFSDPFIIILSVIGSAFICVVIIVALLLAMNAKKWSVFAINLLAMILTVCSSIILSNNILYWIAVNIFIMAIPLTTLMVFDSAYLVINRQIKNRITLAVFKRNYFVLTMIAEKIYLVNTVVIIGAIIAFLVLFPNEPVLLNLAWCMGAINTPAMTMLSGDKGTSKQADMLPDVKNSIVIMYLKFLIGYFSIINLIILSVISLKESSYSLTNITVALIVTALEVAITIILEKKWRLTNWQIQKELWRNPRKYIAPIIVFLVTTAIFLILG